ncbi:Uncharacterised protein [Mycobacterium tuberculosis]|nr:Uncharacterised protein [Mycobacterium tuberculosis]
MQNQMTHRAMVLRRWPAAQMEWIFADSALSALSAAPCTEVSSVCFLVREKSAGEASKRSTTWRA